MTKETIGVATLVAVAFMAVQPYLTVHRMKSYARDGNGEALAEYIDFPSVRASMKDQLNAHLMTSASETKNGLAVGLVVAFAPAMVDQMVDAYVTPTMLAQALSGTDEEAKSKSAASEASSEASSEPDDAVIKQGYVSFDKFVIAMTREGETSRVVLRRQGFGWKMTEIVLPPSLLEDAQ